MDHNDIRTLKILEEINKGRAPSQRDLAKELNVSLGLVNSFVKRLANKGYFKITTIPKNRVRYIMTPMGIAEKSRLTYEFIRYSYKFYTDACQKLRDLYQQLEKAGCYRLALYGANDFAQIAYISCHGTSIDIVSIVDDHRAGERFFDKEITETSALTNLDFDKILIAALFKTSEITDQILSKGITEDRIICF